MTEHREQKDSIEANLRQVRKGSHSDLMFIIAPFAGLLIHNIWAGSVLDFFTSPYLSILNATLAGLAISKYVQCLAYDLVGHPSRSKAANMVAFTTLFSFIPSLILAVNIYSTDQSVEMVTYVQFFIFIFTISIFFSYIRFVNNIHSNDKSDQNRKKHVESNNFPKESLSTDTNE